MIFTLSLEIYSISMTKADFSTSMLYLQCIIQCVARRSVTEPSQHRYRWTASLCTIILPLSKVLEQINNLSQEKNLIECKMHF